MNQQIKNPQQAGVQTTGNHQPRQPQQRGVPPMGNAHQPQQTMGQRPPQQGRYPTNPNRPQQNPYPPQMGGNRQPYQRPIQGRPNMPQQGRPMVRPMSNPSGINTSQHQPISGQPMGQNTVQSMGQTQPAPHNQPISEKDNRFKYIPNFASDYGLPPFIITTKGIITLFVVTLIFGMIFGHAIFGSSAPKQPPRGLQGVINNDDISAQTRKGLRRCGMVVPGQECVLYIMNSTRYDKSAKDFFDDAVRLMGIQRYSIDLVNPRYATRLIPPGRFAEIYIPPMR